MAVLRSFRALRPKDAPQVAALPYDVMNLEEARAMVRGKPDSFLRVDKAELEFPDGTDPHSPPVYQRARENFQNMRRSGALAQDPAPCLYIYRLSTAGGPLGAHSQVGLGACVPVADYEQGHIRRHELTRADKEQDRVRHIEACEAHTGPIFLAYPGREAIRQNLLAWREAHSPLCDFTAEDGVRHQVWAIDDPAAIGALQQLFLPVPRLYIADGHHRNAAAVRVAQARGGPAEAEHNFYLAVLFPMEELKILPYNRLVRDLNGHSPAEFLRALEKDFLVTLGEVPSQGEGSSPGGTPDGAAPGPGRFRLYMEGRWFSLRVKPEALPHTPQDALDAALLQDLVLGPLLNITDPRRDTRVDFAGGIRGPEELTRRVDAGEMAAALLLNPVTMRDIAAVADLGGVMPPKSTWFEPKLRSGLLIHLL